MYRLPCLLLTQAQPDPVTTPESISGPRRSSPASMVQKTTPSTVDIKPIEPPSLPLDVPMVAASERCVHLWVQNVDTRERNYKQEVQKMFARYGELEGVYFFEQKSTHTFRRIHSHPRTALRSKTALVCFKDLTQATNACVL